MTRTDARAFDRARRHPTTRDSRIAAEAGTP